VTLEVAQRVVGVLLGFALGELARTLGPLVVWRAWLHHSALNVGVALAALFWAGLPPHLHHTPEACAGMVHGTARGWLFYGAGLGDRPLPPPPGAP